MGSFVLTACLFVCGREAILHWFGNRYGMLRMYLGFWGLRDAYVLGQLKNAYKPEAYEKLYRLLDEHCQQVPLNCVDTLVDRCFQEWTHPSTPPPKGLFLLLNKAATHHPVKPLFRMCQNVEATSLDSTACWKEFAKAAANIEVLNCPQLLEQATPIILAAPTPPLFEDTSQPCLLFSLKMICTIADGLNANSPLPAWQYMSAVLAHTKFEKRISASTVTVSRKSSSLQHRANAERDDRCNVGASK